MKIKFLSCLLFFYHAISYHIFMSTGFGQRLTMMYWRCGMGAIPPHPSLVVTKVPKCPSFSLVPPTFCTCSSRRTRAIQTSASGSDMRVRTYKTMLKRNHWIYVNTVWFCKLSPASSLEKKYNVNWFCVVKEIKSHSLYIIQSSS